MADIEYRISELTPEKIAHLLNRILQERKRSAAPDNGIKRSTNGHAPLSFSQQRLWFLSQLAPETAAYNVPAGIRLEGKLQRAMLVRSLNEIVRRHETLRTSVATIGGKLVQLVTPEVRIDVPVLDLSHLPPEKREAEVQRLATEEAQQLFDLGQAPLLRARLLRLDVEDHVLLLSLHHLIADGWSIGIFVHELTVLYNAYCTGTASPLPELSIQYRDYAQWQHERLQGEVMEKQVAYWKEQLAGAPALLNIPTSRPRPAIQSFRGAIETAVLPAALCARLNELAQNEGATLFMTLLTGFKALLSRYSGLEDLVVGTPIANRTRAEVENLIGFFVNTLVLRTKLEGEPTFREALHRVKDVCVKAYGHQDVPFEKLVEEIEPDRSLSHNPLFQVMFILQNAPREKLSLNGLKTSPVIGEGKVSLFDLTLLMEEQPQGLQATLQYSTDLFDSVIARRLLGHFQTLLEGAVANPAARISELPLLTEDERHELLVDFNDSARETVPALSLHELFELHAANTPDATALVFGDTKLSYSELNKRANRLAHYLRGLGVGPEVLAGICLERSIDMVVGLLAVLKAGGAYLPLDPSYPQERLAFMLADSKPAVLLTTRALAKRFAGHGLSVVCLDGACFERPGGEEIKTNVNPDNAAYVIYTSGSTGQPKGVVVTHRGLGNLHEEQVRAFGHGPEDRVLQFASLSFDASVFEIVMALATGATLVLATKNELLPGPPLQKLLREQSISNLTIPPSALALMAVDGLPSLRTVIVAGEACSTELVERWSEGREFFNAYGPTETTIWASVSRCFPEELKPSIGKPIGNAQMFVLNEEFEPVPVGVTGELYIGGVGLARGYLNRPELTATRFVPHPFAGRSAPKRGIESPGARLYRTGDLARYRADGRLEFLGRIDTQVKLRGHRIELGEIEAVIARHNEVSEVVVVARADQNGEQRLVAYVVREPGSDVTSRRLREYLKELLPEYMIPSAYVMLEKFPLTSNGKVDRRALPAPESIRTETESGYVAPQSEIERQIAGIWQEILRVEKVGRHDNFFDLGGHSLLVIKLRDRLEELLGQPVTITDVFKFPTVNSFAETLTKDNSTDPLLTRSHDRAEGRKAMAQQRVARRAARSRTRVGVQDV